MKEKTLKKLENYTQERKSLMDELKGLSDEKLNTQPAPEKWSINQVLNHLLMAEAGSLRYLQKKLSGGHKLPNAGWMNTIRMAALKLSLSAPFAIKAPKVVAAPPHPTQFAELQESWSKHDAAMMAFLEQLPEHRFEEEAYKHPLMGKLSLFQMVEFFEAHFRRHREQIRKMID